MKSILIEPLEARIAPATLAISPASITEGDSGTKLLIFTVSLDEEASGPVVVNFATEDGTAISGGDAAEGGQDYVARSGSITFAPGERTKEIQIEINGDTIGEDDETFTVRLSDAVGAEIGTATAIGTILNDAKFTIDSQSMLEGDMGTQEMVFTVSVTEAPVTQTLKVDFATENGTAASGSDYVATQGTLIFEPGTLTQTIGVLINGDTIAEADETFHVRLTNPVGGILQESVGTGTILNDPKFQITSVSKQEGDSGETDFVFTVTLLERLQDDDKTYTVKYWTEDGTAEAGSDYTALTEATLTFGPGITSQNIIVKVMGDTLGEPDETFFVQLADPIGGATIKEGSGRATGTILNDARLSISDARIVEGNNGTQLMIFDVTLLERGPGDVTVDFSTADGTARQIEDYIAQSGRLTFLEGGSDTQQIKVVINGDTRAEGLSEYFLVNLSNPTNARLTDASATGTILDDDALSVSDISVVEGDTDTIVYFTVSLKNLTIPSGQVLKVKYKTEDGSGNPADAAATSGGAVPDYIGIEDGTLVFNPGETTKTIAVTIKGDKTYEPAVEKFSLLLTDASFYTGETKEGDSLPISTPRGVASITQSDVGDAPPTVSIGNAKAAEGNANHYIRFTVHLSAPVGYDTQIKYSTEGIAGSATAGEDYIPVTDAILIIPAGQATGFIDIPIIDDAIEEPDEMFTVVLSEAKLIGGNLPPAGSALTVTNNRAIGTIQNDEQTVSITLDSSASNTGLENSGFIRFKVTLSSASANAVVVNFKTEDITAISSGMFADYTAQASTVTFAPGQTEAFIDIAILDDARYEGDETFKVVLTDVQNAALGPAESISAEATIIDNDAKPTLTVVQQGSAIEGGAVKFLVTLSEALQHDITIPYSFTDGSAKGGAAGSGKDFVNTEGTVTIKAGQTTAEIIVNTMDDAINEPDETFTIHLGENELTQGGATGVGTIKDDGDPLPRLSIADMTILEGDSGEKMAEFIVTLSAVSGHDVVVTYHLFDRTATAGLDYRIPETLTLIIPAGETTGKIFVPIIGDTIAESTETFIVKLSNPQHAVILKGEAIGTILDNERQFSIEFQGAGAGTPNAITVNEPENGTGSTTLKFRIVRSGDASAAASVQYTTADGVDRDGVRGAVSTGDRKDFVARSGTVNFAAGATMSDWIEITINDDDVHEGLEEFFIRLQNGVNGSPAEEGGIGTVQIVDNDAAPTITVSNPTVLEANLSGSAPTKTDMVFKVTLSNPTEVGVVTLKYATADGEAVIGVGGEIITAGATSGTTRADYEALSGTLTFAVGETSKDVIVKVLGDLRDEYDETLQLKLTELNANATFGLDGHGAVRTELAGIGTILDNDAPPTIVISNLSSLNGSALTSAMYGEGDGLTTSKFFRVSLSGESEKEITFKYYTVNGTAIAGEDFIGISEAEAIKLTFAPAHGDTAGETTKDIYINILDDSLVEDAEKFEVHLKDVFGATVLRDRGEAVIQDNDKAIFTINDVTVVEGDDPNTPTIARFIVSLANPIARSVTISYTTVDGTAKASGPFADYIFTAGTLTFDANHTTAFIDVPILGDEYQEATESFTVKLSGGSEVHFAKAEGVGTILNGDDSVIGIAIDDVRVVEGAQGTTTKAQFHVVTSGPLEAGQTVTVKAATRDGLAVAGSDYTAKTATLTFTGTTVSQIFEVSVIGDNIFEATENFFVDLSAATITAGTSTVALERATGSGLIYNDDVQQIDARTVRWVDVDGDIVTLRISKGKLNISDVNDFDFINQITGASGTIPLSSVGGIALRTLNLQNDGREFQGATITITAEPQAIFDPNGTVFLGDGRVDIGWINAGGFSQDGANFFGIDLRNVTIDGGLAKITAGDRTISSPALGKLNVQSLGVNASQVGIENTLSYFQGAVGKVQIAGDMAGQMQVVAAQFGKIGNLTIGGTLGGDATQAGLVLFSGKLGSATIGQIVGGDGANSGTLRGDVTFPTAQIGKVTVLGDILGGDGEESGVINAPKIGKVTVLGSVIGGSGKQSGTIGGVGVDAGDLVTGSIKSIKVAGSVKGGSGDFSGSLNARMINTVSVGEIIGGAGDRSGAIRAGVLGKVAVAGDIVGGSGTGAGLVLADSSLAFGGLAQFGKAQIDGRIIGGEGTNSGVLASDGLFNSIVVKGNIPADATAAPGVSAAVIGGTGSQSGRIHSNYNLGTLVLGTPQVGSSEGTQYSVLGGSGTDSGYVTIGAVNKVILNGDVKGSSHNNTGGLNIVNRMGSMTLNGSLIGGDSVAATENAAGRAVNNTGFISAGQIGKALITGDVISGHDAGAGLSGSGLIAAAQTSIPGTIGKLEIRGDIKGNDSEAVLIAAIGARGKQAIGKLTIGGNVEFLDILAGLAKPNANGLLPRNADAALGNLVFEGNVRALNIAAGAAFGEDGRFGTIDDEILEPASSQAPYLNEATVYSKIASVIIKGQVLAGPQGEGGPESFGLVAQEIGTVMVGGVKLPLQRGESNDRTPRELGTGTGLFVLELPRTNP